VTIKRAATIKAGVLPAALVAKAEIFSKPETRLDFVYFIANQALLINIPLKTTVP